MGLSSVLGWRLPAPPRPVVYFESVEGDEWEGEGRWVVVLWREVGGGRRVELPAPPRPNDIFWEAVGWGSVRRTGILSRLVVLVLIVVLDDLGGDWGKVVDESG